MRYTAPEKLDIFELVKRSGLSVRRTLAPMAIPRSTFYGWYRRYGDGGVNSQNVLELFRAGAHGVVIGSAMYQPGDTPANVARPAVVLVRALSIRDGASHRSVSD